jgi:hypothetical protein
MVPVTRPGSWTFVSPFPAGAAVPWPAGAAVAWPAGAAVAWPAVPAGAAEVPEMPLQEARPRTVTEPASSTPRKRNVTRGEYPARNS